MNADRTLPWDWYPGKIPENAAVDETVYVETTFSFYFFRSRLPLGVEIGRGASTYLGTMFDIGPRGHVKVGAYALVHGARIICDSEIIIGDYALISWNVVLMDSYRFSLDPVERRRQLEVVSSQSPRSAVRPEPTGMSALPIRIERNVWIG